MATTTLTNTRPEEATPSATAFWRIPFLLGLGLGGLGLVAFLAPAIAGVEAMRLLGLLLVAAGLGELVVAFRPGPHRRTWLTGLLGIFSIGTGAAAIVSQSSNFAPTTFVIGTFFAGAGLFRVIISMITRYPHWGWDLAYGALTALLGAWVLAHWPTYSLAFVAAVVGVELILRGSAWVGVGDAIRRALRHDEQFDQHPGGLAHG